MKTLTSQIEQACAITPPFTNERNKSLSKIRWRLKSGLLYAGLDGSHQCALVGPDDAQIFDGRDSEAMKAKYYGAILGREFEIEIVN